MKNISKRQRTWIYICGGNLLYALALSLFLTENNIAAGGLAGIAVAVGKFIPLGVGTLTLIMNVPILCSAVVVNGWTYTVDTIIAAVIYSFTVDLLGKLPVLTRDPLVAAIFGGVLYGLGMSLLTIGSGSVGGTDLLCRLLNKKFPFLSVAKLSLFIDGGIVVLAMIVFGNVGVGLYAIITLFVCSTVADKIIYGIRQGNICVIVTAKNAEEISRPLMATTGRAVTRWNGNGMYTGEDRNVLMMAIRPKEVYEVEKLVKDVDRQAFMVVIPANELIGSNFAAATFVK
ncbi:MAG: YitT family protein [Lachnospiraceae bacterium]|nr:YitT family protein [Lachnospiraceae bacterium]